MGDSNTLDKQEIKRLPATGFHTNPERINRNGRPKRKTLTELIHEKLDNTPDGWDKLVALVLTEVFKGKNKDLVKELWHYTDGMPKQKTEHSGQVAIPILGGQTNVPTNNSDKTLDETTKEN